jgi:hypothetical protein
MRHVIEMRGNDDRDYWECSCGHAGNTRAGDGELQADKHVSEGDQVSYRYPGSGWVVSA